MTRITRVDIALVLAGAFILVAVLAGTALASTPEEVAKNTQHMWSAVGGTIALLVLGFIAIKVLPGKRMGEIIGGVLIGLLVVSLIIAAPAWLSFVKDTAQKLLAARTGVSW